LALKKVDEREVWFVGVCGHILVWDERWGAANATELKIEKSKAHHVKAKGDITCSRYWGSGTLNQQCTGCPDLPLKLSVWVEGVPQVRLHLNARVALVVAAIGYLNDLKVPTDRVWSVPREEFLGDPLSW